MKFEHVRNAARRAHTLGGKLIDMEKHNGDDFLYQCLVRRADEYVVWYYNCNDDAFSSGAYYSLTSLEYAYEKFHERLN